MRNAKGRPSWCVVPLFALLVSLAPPVLAQGGVTCTLCNPGHGPAAAGNGVASYVTVPEGRLTLTDIVMTDTSRLGEDSVHFLRYGVKPGLDVGVGYWDTPGRIRLAVNWQCVAPLKARPAVLIG